MSNHAIKRTRGDEAGFIQPQGGRVKRLANGAITPGDLIEIRTDGDVQSHSTAEGNSAGLVALESTSEESPAGTKQIDHDYDDGDSVRYARTKPGGLYYMWLDAGENVDAGDFLSSAGNGNLKAEAVTVDPTATTAESVAAAAIQFQAVEDVDNSGGTTRTRILAARI